MPHRDNTSGQVKESKQQAILFELENIAINGRDIIFGVIEKVMGSKGVKVLPFTYSRFALNVPLSKFVDTMLQAENKRISEDKLVSDISEKIIKAMLEKSVKADEGLKLVIQRAKEKNIAVGTLSAFKEDHAKELLERIGLKDLGENLLCSHHPERPHLSADAWLKLAKNMAVQPSACLAIVSCKASCKAALTAGMRCVVRPDSFTSFQDFGGADHVIGELNSEVVDIMFELLETK